MLLCMLINVAVTSWKNWPQTRMDASEEVEGRLICAGGLMMMFGLKGLELLRILQPRYGAV